MRTQRRHLFVNLNRSILTKMYDMLSKLYVSFNFCLYFMDLVPSDIIYVITTLSIFEHLEHSYTMHIMSVGITILYGCQENSENFTFLLSLMLKVFL